MKTLILRTASNYLLPILLLFSIFILLRGHYLPGGGFVGGLIASIAFVLHAFANGLKDTKKLLKFHPGFLMPIGLAVSFLAGLLPVIGFDEPFMTGLWMHDTIPVLGALGTAMFFDIGVYIVVQGVTLTIIFTISESA
ncbi:multisubunit sodium/proton antiporter, MrpB subunit [Mesonia phycicola]|uniref:Multisubunit sodium/proton antiporter, MrpB subunit n=1 Tax=Mesonia phycicola TaxID=579105 RepID=A0A1M6CPR8_9FLAO|nr:Na+/H+ antiporter subunit B [Mesonia phycicola]SHI63002.1 multisubunit sodium/proton antiporter, MrpB subunit [Mesonia phycicola]